MGGLTRRSEVSGSRSDKLPRPLTGVVEKNDLFERQLRLVGSCLRHEEHVGTAVRHLAPSRSEHPSGRCLLQSRPFRRIACCDKRVGGPPCYPCVCDTYMRQRSHQDKCSRLATLPQFHNYTQPTISNSYTKFHLSDIPILDASTPIRLPEAPIPSPFVKDGHEGQLDGAWSFHLYFRDDRQVLQTLEKVRVPVTDKIRDSDRGWDVLLFTPQEAQNAFAGVVASGRIRRVLTGVMGSEGEFH